MTTRAYVPNADGEGSIGTGEKKWGAMYVASPDSGANDSHVPSTAWVQSIVAEAIKTAKDEIYKQAKLDAHPVGSYYWSNDSTSPATLFGGTWEALPPGYTLIAQGSGSDSFGSFTYEAGQKYGERKHQLTTDEMAPHVHQERMTTSDGNSNPLVNLQTNGTLSGATVPQAFGYTKKATDTVNTVSAGGGEGHNNIPPVIASYAWRRTA